VATGPWCHVTQHHHPACEPLLIGDNGGADNRDDKKQMAEMMMWQLLEIFLSPFGHAYSLDICTVIHAYTAD